MEPCWYERDPPILREVTISGAQLPPHNCAPGDNRCYVFPDPLHEAIQTLTPKGRCPIGWIVVNSGPDSWDVWLDVNTGEAQLKRRPK